jgi:hypothetical protein
MKKYLIVSPIIVLLFTSQLYSQNWQWALSSGKSNGDDFGRIDIDNNSNLYLAGIFYQFNGIFGNDTLLTNGGNDIVLAKLNSSGNFQWARQIGGNNLEGIGGINFNSSSNSIFIGGNFYDSIAFGTISLIASGSNDIFFAKYDLNGNCVWAKKAGGNGSDNSFRISSDNNGNFYAVGLVTDTAYFDSHMVTSGMYLTKYNNNGLCQWAKNVSYGVSIINISCFNNEVLVSGWSGNDTIIVDPDTLYSNSVGDDLFLAKFDANGNLIWAELDGGGMVASTAGAKFDDNGNIYAPCNLGSADTATFGSVIFPPPAGGFQVCLVKYNNNGTFIWARETNCTMDFRVNDISVNNSDGSCYLTGNFSGTVSIGSYTVSAAPGNVDMYIARFNTNGDCLGIRNTKVDIGGPSPGAGNSVVQDAANCYVAGQFRNTANFDSYSITSTFTTKDIFIAKIDVFTGIGGLDKISNNQLEIYANPNRGTFNIKVPDEVKTFKKAVLIIYNSAGKETTRFPLDNENDYPHFDVANSAKGMYTIKLLQGNKSYTGKLVVE